MKGGRAREATTWVVVLFTVCLSLAYLVPHSSKLSVVAAVAVALAGIALYDPVLLPLVAMPLLVVSNRIGGGGLNLSLADAALFAAFWPALFFGRRPYTRLMRTALWLCGIYQFGSLFTVIANPYRQNTTEWFHAALLVGGALVVGWTVGASGRANLGVGLFVLACVAIGVDAVVLGAAQGFASPVYPTFPVPLAKNFAGPLLSWAALVCFALPSWLRWPTWATVPAFVICTLGTFATQSRQALVGLGVGMVIIAFRPGMGRRLGRKLLLIATTPIMLVVVASVRSDLSGENQFNSTALRVPGLEAGLEVWRTDPWFGAGLRWWIGSPHANGFQPPSVFIEVLSSVGLVGFAAFAVLMLGSLAIAWRIEPVVGTLAVAIIASRIVQSQFDQFWVSSLVSVPFVLLGVCLGVQAYNARTGRAQLIAGELEPPASFREVPSPARSDSLGLAGRA
ncbi:MAG TPA: O-antigen ligase family protein [Luteimicrobium sp.]|nr:O-antigen ligase family protein [Luteimicrobium sp.]